MRYLVSCFALVAASALALPAIAQPPDKDANKDGNKGGDRRAEMRERMLKDFDTNKDGKLDDQERAKAREKMREMRANRQSGRRGAAGARGPAGSRGAAGRTVPKAIVDRVRKCLIRRRCSLSLTKTKMASSAKTNSWH